MVNSLAIYFMKLVLYFIVRKTV